MSGSKAARKVAMLRKGKPERRHARFYEWEIDSPAFRSLDVYARALLLEFKALYNGANNGELYMSVRDACKRLGITSKDYAAAALRRLEDRGFIAVTRKGSRTRRGEQKLATTWQLTEYADDMTGQPATRDFMHWRPPATPTPTPAAAAKRVRMAQRARKAARARWAQNNSTVPKQASDRTETSISDTQNAADHACKGTVKHNSDASTVPPQGTQIYLPWAAGAAPAQAPDPPPATPPDRTAAPEPTPAAALSGVGRADHPAKNGESAKNHPDLSRWPKGREFGPWLARTRHALHVQVVELATAIGIGVGDLVGIETGRNGLGIGLQRKAVAFLRERAA